MAMNPRLLRPTASGFNPKSISSLGLWLDAADSSTVTLDTGVSAWGDKSGKSRNATQGTGASQPAYTANSLNGKPTMTFDGSNDSFATTSFNLSGPLTVVMVARTLVNGRHFFESNNTSTRCTFYSDASSNWVAFGGSFLSSTGGASNAWRFFAIVFNGSSSSIRVGNTTVATGNTGSAGLTSGFRIGAFSAAGALLNGNIAEFLMWEKAMSDSEISSVAKYAKSKWGVA